jgi:hypothetical protein
MQIKIKPEKSRLHTGDWPVLARLFRPTKGAAPVRAYLVLPPAAISGQADIGLAEKEIGRNAQYQKDQ